VRSILQPMSLLLVGLGKLEYRDINTDWASSVVKASKSRKVGNLWVDIF
jgi:hypothetical protein